MSTSCENDAGVYANLDEYAEFLKDKAVASLHLLDALQKQPPETNDSDANQDDRSKVNNEKSDGPMILNI